jgi:glyoxylase-like metal-dependent hydrolase (beta-lactamase superfamily II)
MWPSRRGPAVRLWPDQLEHVLDESLIAVRREALRVGENRSSGCLTKVANGPRRQLDIEPRGQLAAIDRPLNQSLDSLENATAIELNVRSDDGGRSVQGQQDQTPRGRPVHHSVEEPPDRSRQHLNRLTLSGVARNHRHDLLELLQGIALLALNQRVQQAREVGKVVVDDRPSHPGGPRDRFDRHAAVTVLENHSEGGVDQLLTALCRGHARCISPPCLLGLGRSWSRRSRHSALQQGYRQLRSRSFIGDAIGSLAIAAAHEIAPGVYRLGNSIFNWYLVEDGGRLTAVDAGLPGFRGSLVADLAGLGFALGDIDAVILTHSDADHTGLAPTMHDAGARVLIHAADEPKLRKPGPKSGDAKPQNILPELWRPSLWKTIAAMARAQGFKMAKMNDAETFRDDAVLDVPGRPRVIPTPGHTPGHCAFYFEGRRALFVGDAMCALSPVTHRTGPQLMPRVMNESNELAIQSLDALEPIDADVLLFGHGDPWREGVGSAVKQARSAART